MTSSSFLKLKNESSQLDIVDYTVRSLISFSKGFVYSCGVGYVHLFEKDRNKYKKRNVFVVKDVVCDFHSPKINTVTHLSVNLSQDKLLATTKRAQMYVVRLWGPDLNVVCTVNVIFVNY
mgnify:FL=1